MTAQVHGPALPASGDAMTLNPLTSIGQLDRAAATNAGSIRLWGSALGVGRMDAYGSIVESERRTVAIGVASEGEVRTWTRRTASGSLDGASMFVGA